MLALREKAIIRSNPDASSSHSASLLLMAGSIIGGEWVKTSRGPNYSLKSV